MKANLPAIIVVKDYHEFPYIKDIMCGILPGIKIKEIGFDGSYVGMVYAGSLKDKQNKKVLQEMRKRLTKENSRHNCASWHERTACNTTRVPGHQ